MTIADAPDLLVTEQGGDAVMADQIIVTQSVIAVKNHNGISCIFIIDMSSFNRKHIPNRAFKVSPVRVSVSQ
jgi:hypothetical protein